MIPYESYDSGCFVRFVLAFKLHIDGPHSILNFFRFLTFLKKLRIECFYSIVNFFRFLTFSKKLRIECFHSIPNFFRFFAFFYKVENRVFSLDSQLFLEKVKNRKKLRI
jgi:hypothetical protein